MNREYQDLIRSPRVSEQTRRTLMKRGMPDSADYQPITLNIAELTTLRSVLARVVPQNGSSSEDAIDIAARMDKMLGEDKGDGWRFATLPADADACRIGLRLLDQLDGASFKELSPESQDELLKGIAAGQITSEEFNLQRWFEDLRANATQIYVSHPETLARMGYSGIADDPNGFVQLSIGKAESWEPKRQ